MTGDLEDRCRKLVGELGISSPENVRGILPLTGGVASDIAMVDLGVRRICVKFALPKLKVAADWHAPVHRNAAEYAWLKVAAQLFPESAIELLGHSQTQHGFAMEFLEGTDVVLWKTSLLSGGGDHGEAAKVGGMLGRIHDASSKVDFDKSKFHNHDDFRALRIEPYLSFTRAAHPGLSDVFLSMEEELYTNRRVLLHGDASPKNILFRNGAPILLDAECATMGDACFDPSFCLNHLVLKAIHVPDTRARLLEAIDEFWDAYSRSITWEQPDAVERRVCRLLPTLMLARVDGKSPVEYLNGDEQALVRRISIPLVQSPTTSLTEFSAHLSHELRLEAQ